MAECVPEPVVVSAEHVLYGIRFAELCLAEVIDLAKRGGAAREDRYAEKALAYLAERGGVGRSDILNDVPEKGLTREQRWRVIEGLAQDGSVEIHKQNTAGRPRYEVTLSPLSPFKCGGTVSPTQAGRLADGITPKKHTITGREYPQKKGSKAI